MRRLTAWVGGAVGGITAYRWLRRRLPVGTEPEPEPPATETDERAEELRAKLAETRAPETVAGETPPEPVAEEAQPPAQPEAETEAEPESPADRRLRVHEEARAALDEMKPE
jgi:hypothetical protein